MRPITQIVMHCSDSPDTLDLKASDIREMHITERGFNDIGYHYVIRRSGLLETGRPLEQVGAHVKGFNRFSVGICLIGRRNFDKRQLKTLNTLIRELMERFHLRPESVVGHYELNQHKTCPNIFMPDIRKTLS